MNKHEYANLISFTTRLVLCDYLCCTSLLLKGQRSFWETQTDLGSVFVSLLHNCTVFHWATFHGAARLVFMSQFWFVFLVPSLVLPIVLYVTYQCYFLPFVWFSHFHLCSCIFFFVYGIIFSRLYFRHVNIHPYIWIYAQIFMNLPVCKCLRYSRFFVC